MPKSIRIATRSTPLAIIQTELVASALRERGYEVERLELRSLGDRSLGGNLTVRRGVFTAELDQALLEGRADIAVHSLKDLPVELDPRLAIVAVPERASPNDLLLVHGSQGAPWQPLEVLLEQGPPGPSSGLTPTEAFESLEEGAVIGTSSPRRQAGALHVRPDLVCCAVRGSVGRRLEWLRARSVQALLLAEAGLARLFRAGEAKELFEGLSACRLVASQWPPAPGQGALAVVALAGSAWQDHPGLSELSHADSWAAASQERAVLTVLGGGCALPIGAFCSLDASSPEGSVGRISVVLAAEDWREAASIGSGPALLRSELELADLAARDSAVRRSEIAHLKRQAAARKSASVAVAESPAPELVITSSRETTKRLSAALEEEAGRVVDVREFPVTKTKVLEQEWPVEIAEQLMTEASQSGRGRRHWPWVVVSSPSAARVICERAQWEARWSSLPWCALGSGTARTLLRLGCPPNLVADARDAVGLSAFVGEHLRRAAALFVPQSQLADAGLGDALREQGFEVHAFAAYTKTPVADLSWPEAWHGPPERILFTSASSVAAVAEAGLSAPVCWALGETTANEMRHRGFAVAGVAEAPTARGVAALWS